MAQGEEPLSPASNPAGQVAEAELEVENPGIAPKSSVLQTRATVTGAVVLTVLAGYAAASVIYSLPSVLRTYVALSATAGGLIVGGLLTLIVIIPSARPNPNVKTEFFSARAGYMCVTAGLVLLGLVTIGALVARVALTIKGHY